MCTKDRIDWSKFIDKTYVIIVQRMAAGLDNVKNKQS